MIILGISCFYHDATAALLIDGKVVSAAAEERFSRIKHDSSFPIKAIAFCLAESNLRIEDIDYIAFYEKPYLKFERFLTSVTLGFPQTFWHFVSAAPAWIKERTAVLGIIRKKLKYKKKILFVDHHLSHAGSFFASPFDEAAILVADGVGEFTTTSFGFGKNARLELKSEMDFPHSLGLFYSAITTYLGFSVNDAEYKVMGLAAFGDQNRETNVYYERLRKTLDLKEDGSFQMDMSYYRYQYGRTMTSQKLWKLLGGKPRKGEEVETRHQDIAAALQMLTEDILTAILIHIHKEVPSDNLVFAGGVALNSVFNGKILSKTPFKNVWILPDPGDGGTSVGAALYAYHQVLQFSKRQKFTGAYLGPMSSQEDIRHFLDSSGISYTEFKSEEELIQETAKCIYSNDVVGWFQGHMEFGPRALGNRSILANPLYEGMQDVLNLKVKHREKFRPFAPAVLREHAAEYFECDPVYQDPCAFMLMVYPVQKKWRSKLPAVTHIDGSGRLQTVSREDNPLYYDLISEFKKISGVPIVVNTSYNVRGEPIVCTPYDAYRCMMGTGIDCLVMGHFLIERKNNEKDAWDSDAPQQSFLFDLKKAYKELFLVLGIILVMLGAAEFAVRHFDHLIHKNNLYVRDDTLGWVVNPLRNPASDGFMEQSIDLQKEDPSTLMYAVGDSFTYGIVGYKNNFVTKIDDALPHYDVVNLGVPGYGMSQFYVLIKKYAEIQKPKYILLNIFTDDMLRVDLESRMAILNGGWQYVPPEALSLYHSSYLFSDLYEAYISIGARFSVSSVVPCRGGETESQYDCLERSRLSISLKKYLPATESAFNSNLAYLQQTIEYCKKNNIALIVAILPDEFQVNKPLRDKVFALYNLKPENYLLNKPQQLIESVLDKEGIPYIDLLPQFVQLSKKEVLYKPNNSHWNELGNAEASRIILDELATRKLLEPLPF